MVFKNPLPARERVFLRTIRHGKRLASLPANVGSFYGAKLED